MMEPICFTEDDIYNHRNRFADVDARMFPKNGKGAEYRTGECKRCGKPSGPYATCRECREIAKVARITKQLVKEGKVERLTDGRGVKGGAKYRVKKKVPFCNNNKTGRNDPCPCGSGKKFKKCCRV